jgi:hypothetical protein
MDREMHTSKAVLTFLAGSALGVGAGLLVSKAYRAKGQVAATTGRQKAPSGAHNTSTPYCAVPEGADICYPE